MCDSAYGPNRNGVSVGRRQRARERGILGVGVLLAACGGGGGLGAVGQIDASADSSPGGASSSGTSSSGGVSSGGGSGGSNGGSSGSSSGGGGSGSSSGGGSSGGSSGGGSSGSSSGGQDGGPSSTCAPTPGTTVQTVSCSAIELAVLQGSSAPAVTVRGVTNVTGTQGGAEDCALVDSIDILDPTIIVDGGSANIGTLTGVTANVLAEDASSLLGTGTASSTLAGMCSSDSNRFSALTVVIHGQTNGGSFVSTCGAGDGQWPPSVVLTCQTGVPGEIAPADSIETVGSVMGSSFAYDSIFETLPQPPTSFATFSSTIHLIPEQAPFGGGAPLSPSDSTGWSGYGSTTEGADGTLYSQVELTSSSALLGATLCPPGCTTPIACQPGPVFIARFTGSSDQGAFTSEVYTRQCDQANMP
jgi:hypothetical protein